MTFLKRSHAHVLVGSDMSTLESNKFLVPFQRAGGNGAADRRDRHVTHERGTFVVPETHLVSIR